MTECKDCKYAIWDFEEYYPFVRHFVVSGCKLDNDDENCEDFEESDPDPEGW